MPLLALGFGRTPCPIKLVSRMGTKLLCRISWHYRAGWSVFIRETGPLRAKKDTLLGRKAGQSIGEIFPRLLALKCSSHFTFLVSWIITTFCLSEPPCSALHTQGWPQHIAQSRHSAEICWMSEWMPESSDRSYSLLKGNFEKFSRSNRNSRRQRAGKHALFLS